MRRPASCWTLPADMFKGVRQRAILATLLYHGMRREELCRLRVRDIQSGQGGMHFWVKGKRDKVRFVLVHAMAHIQSVWRRINGLQTRCAKIKAASFMTRAKRRRGFRRSSATPRHI
jgi:integrase